MKPARRTRIAALLVLATLAWSPGVLSAGCAIACPFAKAVAGRRCCRPHGGAPAVGAASCCEALRATSPVETSRAVAPSSPAAFSPAPPAELPEVQVASEPIPEVPLSPPPLHEGIGLYTLHAAFLI
jgi:hypothetical protein